MANDVKRIELIVSVEFGFWQELEDVIRHIMAHKNVAGVADWQHDVEDPAESGSAAGWVEKPRKDGAIDNKTFTYNITMVGSEKGSVSMLKLGSINKLVGRINETYDDEQLGLPAETNEDE